MLPSKQLIRSPSGWKEYFLPMRAVDRTFAGASKLRTDTAVKLMDELKFTCIRGNISEIKTLALGSGTTKGVDADVADAVTEDTLDMLFSIL